MHPFWCISEKRCRYGALDLFTKSDSENPPDVYKRQGLDGATVCMEGFGASGPANELFEKFGFTAAHVAEVVKSL